MRIQENNTFQDFIPLTFFKGKDGNGDDVMDFEGIASTNSEDADGEFLDPTGFDSEYFLKSGWFNWNHQTNSDPSSIVGRPTAVEVTPENKYKIKGRLLRTSKKAQQIYQLQKALEAEGMQLGLSIEGKVLLRDPMNKKVVKKALITGCAITPNPKNSDTNMRLLKGQEFGALIDDDLKKALSAYEDSTDDEREKAMDTGAVAPLTKESVDKKLKPVDDKLKKMEGEDDDEEEDEEGEEKEGGGEEIEKGNSLEKVLLSLPHIKAEDALQIHDLLKKGQKEMDNTDKKIQESTYFQKALSFLNLANSNKEVVQEATQEETSNGDFLAKSFESMDPDERLQAKIMLEKGLSELNSFNEPTDKENEIPFSDDIIKSMENSINELPNEIGEVLQKSFQAIGELLLGNVNASEEIVKSIEGISDRLENIESQPQASRAVTTENYVQKSFDGPQANTNTPKANKRVIVDTIMKSQEGSNYANISLCQEVAAYETTNIMSPLVKAEAVKLGLM